MIRAERDERKAIINDTDTIDATNQALPHSPNQLGTTNEDDIFALFLEKGERDRTDDGEDSSTTTDENGNDAPWNSIENDCRYELELYKRVPAIQLYNKEMNGQKRKLADPLQWWKVNEHKYPVIIPSCSTNISLVRMNL